MPHTEGGWEIISLDRVPGLSITSDIISKCWMSRECFTFSKPRNSLAPFEEEMSLATHRTASWKRLLWNSKAPPGTRRSPWSLPKKHFIHICTLLREPIDKTQLNGPCRIYFLFPPGKLNVFLKRRNCLFWNGSNLERICNNSTKDFIWPSCKFLKC